MARHPVWNFTPSLIFRSLALSYKLGNKRGENVRKLGQNMSGNCQECQEFSTLQKSGHPEVADPTIFNFRCFVDHWIVPDSSVCFSFPMSLQIIKSNNFQDTYVFISITHANLINLYFLMETMGLSGLVEKLRPHWINSLFLIPMRITFWSFIAKIFLFFLHIFQIFTYFSLTSPLVSNIMISPKT